MSRLLSLSLLLPVFGAFAAETNEVVRPLPFPDKLLSAYTTLFPWKEDIVEHNERMISRLSANGFNSIDVLMLLRDTTNFVAEMKREQSAVERVCRFANQNGLVFNACVYPYPGTAGEGRHVEEFTKTETWLKLFPNAVEFARQSKAIGIASIRFDLETTTLKENISEEQMLRITIAVKGFADALRAYNPDLILGYMPAMHHAMSPAFNKALATDRLPAILDAWDLYNGEGYTESVRQNALRAKRAHPNNRYVPWIRHNSYYAEDIASTAFHAAKNADGHSSWLLYMIDPKSCLYMKDIFALPKGEKVDDYWSAYKRANEAIRNGTEIPFKKVRPLVPALDYASVKYPDVSLLPYEKTGKTRLTTSDRRTFFMHAKAGETIVMRMRHLAGQARPLSLHYAILTPDRVALRDECIPPGQEETFSVVTPQDGIYAILTSGGEAGQAWYLVESTDHPFYMEKTYLFGPQRFRVMGRKAGNPELKIRCFGEEAYRWRVDGGEWRDQVFKSVNQFELPEAECEVEIAPHPATSYCQNFWITFPNGKVPYVRSASVK